MPFHGRLDPSAVDLGVLVYAEHEDLLPGEALAVTEHTLVALRSAPVTLGEVAPDRYADSVVAHFAPTRGALLQVLVSQFHGIERKARRRRNAERVVAIR